VHDNKFAVYSELGWVSKKPASGISGVSFYMLYKEAELRTFN